MTDPHDADDAPGPDAHDAPADPDVPDMADNFGLDAEPGTKGVKASGAGLTTTTDPDPSDTEPITGVGLGAFRIGRP